MIAQGNPLMTLKAQSSQPRNFSFELEIACTFLVAGISSESREPDVVLHDGGDKWNLACKMIYTPNSVTLGDRIEEGIGQILKYKNDYGMVVIGLSNRIDHNYFSPLIDDEKDIWGAFRNTDQVISRIGQVMGPTIDEIKKQGQTRFKDGKNSPRFRGIMIVLHSICSIRATFSMLTGVGLVQRHDLGLPHLAEMPEVRLAKTFNDTAQKMLLD
jgi:hypothetical protein